MPKRIPTIDDVFRNEQRDVFVVYFSDSDKQARQTAWQEIQAWLREHTPDSPVETIDMLGYLSSMTGGPLALRIDFTDADLQRFCQRWEDPRGESLDPRFRRCKLSHESWMKYDEW